MTIENLSMFLKQIHFVRWALAAILLNVAVYTFAVLPEKAKIVNLQSAYAGSRKQAIEEQRDLRQLEVRLGRLEQAKKDLQYLYGNVLVPKKSGVMDIRLELEGLAEELHVKRSDFSYSYTPIPELRLRQFRVSVPIEGSYRDIRRFINSIERSRHFLILDRVDLSSMQANVLNMSFSLSTYLVEDEI